MECLTVWSAVPLMRSKGRICTPKASPEGNPEGEPGKQPRRRARKATPKAIPQGSPVGHPKTVPGKTQEAEALLLHPNHGHRLLLDVVERVALELDLLEVDVHQVDAADVAVPRRTVI